MDQAAEKDLDIRLDGKKLNQQDSFVYLGGAVCGDGSTEMEICRKVQAEVSVWRKVQAEVSVWRKVQAEVSVWRKVQAEVSM